MAEEPSSVPMTSAEEGVRTWDAAITNAEHRANEARLQYGYALLQLRTEVENSDKAFGNKLQELGLKATKDIQADAQRVARAVQSGDMTEERALHLTAREVRLLSHIVREEDGKKHWHVRTPKLPEKRPRPKAQKEPNLFDAPPPTATIEAAEPTGGDDEASAIDHWQAAGGADVSVGGDADTQVVDQNGDISSTPEATEEPIAEGAGIADECGVAEQVGSAADSSSSLKAIIRTMIEPEISTWKKPRNHIESRVDLDTSGKNRVQALLFKIMDLVAT